MFVQWRRHGVAVCYIHLHDSYPFTQGRQFRHHGRLVSLPWECLGTESATQRTRAAKPSSVQLLSSLGYALATSGDRRQAVGYYRKALESDPNDIVTHGRLALTLASLGDVDGVLDLPL